MVTNRPEISIIEALLKRPNRSFRRYTLVFRDGVAQFERDPIRKAFDEILEELGGPPADRE
jgi:hypothetical protein